MASEGLSKCDLNAANESTMPFVGGKRNMKKKSYKNKFSLLFPLGAKVVKTKSLGL